MKMRKRKSSGDRLLAVLGLFTEKPQWTVEAAAEQIGVSAPTAYRYFRQLTDVGLISPVSSAQYTLGPAIIQMDRQIRTTDPMLNAARGIMVDLVQYTAEGSTILLCRLFHNQVMCVHQVMGRGPQLPVSYERGRLMPLFRGATSRIILATLTSRTLKSIFAQNEKEIAAAGLGETWAEFRAKLAELRRAGYCITRGDIDAGRVGIAAAIFNDERAVLGSLSFVLPARHADEKLIHRLALLTIAGAHEIERTMLQSDAVLSSPVRLKIAK